MAKRDIQVGKYYQFFTDEDCHHSLKNKSGLIVRVLAVKLTGTKKTYECECPLGTRIDVHGNELKPIVRRSDMPEFEYQGGDYVILTDDIPFDMETLAFGTIRQVDHAFITSKRWVHLIHGTQVVVAPVSKMALAHRVKS